MNVIGSLPPKAWTNVIRGSIIIALAAAAGSLTLTYAIMAVFSGGMPVIAAVISVLAPLSLAGPSSFFQLLRNEQLRIANRRLEQLASVDWLTDCLNRRAFTARIAELRRSPDGGAGAFLIIDADYFKTINDRFGHEHGDEALQLIAADIKGAVRRADLVGRIGGEEFGVFLPGVELGVATEIAERIRSRINARAMGGAGEVHLSVSVGGAVFGPEASFTELFRAADQRLYLAKRSGRNRVRLTRLPEIGEVEDDAGLAAG